MCSRRADRSLTPLVIASAVLFSPAAAQAYIDPGTTGMVVGGCAGVLAWGLLLVTILRKRLLQVLRFSGRLIAAHSVVSAGALLAVAALGVASWMWFGRGKAIMTEQVVGTAFERVVLLGVDGVDPDDLHALMEADLIPNFKRVAEAGGFKRLAVVHPAQSPVVWSSLATGQNPGRHGIFDFIGRDPARYLPRLAVLNQDASGYHYPIQATAFWDVTAAAKIPTTIIRWPLTFPPERIQAKVLAGLGVPDLRGGLGRYTLFTDRAPEPGADGADKIEVVTIENGAFQATLTGPKARGLTGAKDLTLPLKVQIGADGQNAVITVGQQNFALAAGEWSDWAELTFSSGLFGKHRGLVKFHLNSARDPFALYATAIEMHPDAPIFDFTHPPEFAKQLRTEIGLYHTLGMPEDTKAFGDGHLSEKAFFEMCRAVEAERRAMFVAELGRFDRGVLAMVFDTSDRIQHMTPHDGAVATTAIGRYLIEFDRFLGTVLEELPPRTPLIIFSDHGFSDFDRAVDLNRWLANEGYLAVDQEAFARRSPGDNGELFKYVQWDRSRAYAVGFAGIFLNLKGREGQGIVAPEEAEALTKEIATKLGALKDEDGRTVVHAVYPSATIYSGDHLSTAPDLVMGYKPGYRGAWQSAIGGLDDVVISDNDKLWQRDHIVDPSFVEASIMTNFEIEVDRPTVLDLAPTVLSLLGVGVPTEMEGRPLHIMPGEGDQTAATGRRP